MRMKKEYWKNLEPYAIRSRRNNVHVRLVGHDKALCGRSLNPEFDPNQEDRWERLDRPTTHKLCKMCKRSLLKLKDPRDNSVQNALKLQKEIQIIEKEISLKTDEKYDDQIEEEFPTELNIKLEKLTNLEKCIPHMINDLYEQWKDSDCPHNLEIMDQLKTIHPHIKLIKELLK